MTEKNIIERIEEELQPLERVFQNMLKQNSLKPETREKIMQNLTAFSFFRKSVEKASRDFFIFSSSQRGSVERMSP